MAPQYNALDGVVAASALLALVPYRIAIGRGGGARAQPLLTALVIWALLLDASAITTAIARAKWQEEAELRLETGFYDPTTANVGKPAWPWRTWAGLAVGYAAIVVWAGMTPRQFNDSSLNKTAAS